MQRELCYNLPATAKLIKGMGVSKIHMSPSSAISPSEREGLLKKYIEQKGFVRLIEAHSGLSALIGQTTKVEENGNFIEYDGFWESSFADSATKGMPDVEIVSYDSRCVKHRHV